MMDGSLPLLEADNWLRPIGARRRATRHNIARIVGWRSASQLPAAFLAKVLQRFLRQTIQSPGGNVSPKLALPLPRIEFRIPLAKPRQLLRGELFQGLLNFGDAAHLQIIPTSGGVAK